MKAITIHQPWASLIALGVKRFETRGWKTNYRGPIAIHAGKRRDDDACLMLASKYVRIWRKITPMPTGCIVAVAELAGCYRIYDTIDNGKHIVRCPDDKYEFDKVEYLWKPETDFGHFAHGRYAWELANVCRIEPVHVKGKQGLWNWGEDVTA